MAAGRASATAAAGAAAPARASDRSPPAARKKYRQAPGGMIALALAAQDRSIGLTDGTQGIEADAAV